MSNHVFSGSHVEKYHERVVQQLAEELRARGKPILFPDKQDRHNSQPDISVEGHIAVEVKILNPTKEDFAINERAKLALSQGEPAQWGGTLNSAPLQEDMESAVKKFKGRSETYRLVVFASPLEFQMSKHRLEPLLKGVTQLIFRLPSGDIIKSKQINVPVTKRASSVINGILLMHGEDLHLRHLFIIGGEQNADVESLAQTISKLF